MRKRRRQGFKVLKDRDKRYGFSKYDSHGNVIYSESSGSEGELLRHFYAYDESDRRIYYKVESQKESYEEITQYLPNNGKKLTCIFVPLYTVIIKEYNEMGRMLKSDSIDKNGRIVHREFDGLKYNITYGMEPFHINNIIYEGLK